MVTQTRLIFLDSMLKLGMGWLQMCPLNEKSAIMLDL